MLELADIVRAAGGVYQRLHASTLLPSQRRALRDIVACRTAALGGHVRACDHCGTRQYSYHSCRNRHCPKCHGEQTQRWLDRQRARLLPCGYFLLTFTLPAELRALARAHQKRVYGVLMTAAAAALLTLTADPRYLFRIALVNSRLEQFENGQVTFRYRGGRTGLIRRCTLDAGAFLGRFLQHVLPQG